MILPLYPCVHSDSHVMFLKCSR